MPSADQGGSGRPPKPRKFVLHRTMSSEQPVQNARSKNMSLVWPPSVPASSAQAPSKPMHKQFKRDTTTAPSSSVPSIITKHNPSVPRHLFGRQTPAQFSDTSPKPSGAPRKTTSALKALASKTSRRHSSAASVTSSQNSVRICRRCQRPGLTEDPLFKCVTCRHRYHKAHLIHPKPEQLALIRKHGLRPLQPHEPGFQCHTCLIILSVEMEVATSSVKRPIVTMTMLGDAIKACNRQQSAEDKKDAVSRFKRLLMGDVPTERQKAAGNTSAKDFNVASASIERRKIAKNNNVMPSTDLPPHQPQTATAAQPCPSDMVECQTMAGELPEDILCESSHIDEAIADAEVMLRRSVSIGPIQRRVNNPRKRPRDQGPSSVPVPDLDDTLPEAEGIAGTQHSADPSCKEGATVAGNEERLTPLSKRSSSTADGSGAAEAEKEPTLFEPPQVRLGVHVDQHSRSALSSSVKSGLQHSAKVPTPIVSVAAVSTNTGAQTGAAGRAALLKRLAEEQDGARLSEATPSRLEPKLNREKRKKVTPAECKVCGKIFGARDEQRLCIPCLKKRKATSSLADESDTTSVSMLSSTIASPVQRSSTKQDTTSPESGTRGRKAAPGLGTLTSRTEEAALTIIGMALLSAPNHRLQTKGIADWITQNLPDYQTAAPYEKFAKRISYHLSMNRFRDEEPDRPCLWTKTEALDGEEGVAGNSWWEINRNAARKWYAWDAVEKKAADQPYHFAQPIAGSVISISSDDDSTGPTARPNVRAGKKRRLCRGRQFTDLHDKVMVDAGAQTETTPTAASLNGVAVQSTYVDKGVGSVEPASAHDDLDVVMMDAPEIPVLKSTEHETPVSADSMVGPEDMVELEDVIMESRSDLAPQSLQDEEPKADGTTHRASRRPTSNDSLDMLFGLHKPAMLSALLERKITAKAKTSSNLFDLVLKEEDKIDPQRQQTRIAARPGRKTLFGKEVLRSRLGDPHDFVQRNRAPKSVANSPSKRPTVRYDPGPDDFAATPPSQEVLKVCSSIEELVGIPENCIPIIDANKHLAFRDGTRYNGVLPRAKTVYSTGYGS